ncbi:MAG: hypothetical protein GY898_18795 [Proteobacteria bacterium]|nr:hypothetical protein [Pseudomonadota bacterium]
MTRVLASAESFCAMILCAIATGYVFIFSGCSPVMDLETARAEAQYMPVEVAATLALGISRAQDYGAHSVAVHSSYSNGTPITQDGCIGIALTDDFAIDGVGELVYDFGACGSQSGLVQVNQTVTYSLPEGQSAEDFADENDNGIPDEFENGGMDGSGLVGEITATANINVTYNGYKEGLLNMSGGMALAGGVLDSDGTGGDLAAALSVSALDYGTTVTADGTWAASPANPDAQLLSFAGSFTSATGLEWTIVAENVEMAPGCNDAMGGQLTARYSGEAGDVEVIAVFDNVCDGCAHLIIDGVSQGQACFPDSPLLQTNNDDREEA